MGQADAVSTDAVTARGRRHRVGDRVFRTTTFAAGLALVVLLALLLWVLLDGSWRAITEFRFHFLIGRDWDPTSNAFGAFAFSHFSTRIQGFI